MKSTLLLVAAAAALFGPATGAGFDGIPGDYCKVRRPTCCPSRDDDCTAPILGNHLCYCDMFCDRADGGDCCPDFKETCIGLRPAPSTGTGDCSYNGVQFREGEEVKQNCQNCRCTNNRWECGAQKTCLIQEDLLERVGKGRYTWTARNYTNFWGKSLEDGIKFRLGTLFPEQSVQNMNEILIKPRELPASFDARTKWPDYIHPIRDQGDCGSSWAFSTTSTSADRLAIMSEGKLNENVSPQQLLSCNQHRQRGCEGGYLDRAWWYIRKLGVVSDECYPYDSGRTQVPGECQIPKAQYRRAEGLTCPSPSSNNKIYKMTPPYRVSDKEEDIMTEIMTNGPVQATFVVHEDFFMYSGGVYENTDLARNKGPSYAGEGYHSVRLIGWGEDDSTGRPVKYWLAANSWGPEWGENGFFRILRGDNHCEIESFIIGAWGKGSKRRRRRFKIRKMRRRRMRKL